MLNKIFTKLWNNPIPTVGISIVVCIFIYAAATAYRNYSFEQTIDANQASAQNAASEASNYEHQASNASVERQVEDGVRTQVILPKLQTARRNSAHSAQNLKVAKQKYENEKTNTSNLSRSDSDNCRELRELFPNVRFDDCSGAK